MKPTVILEGHSIPETGHLDLNVQVSAMVMIAAREAQRRVTGFVTDRISYLMHGGEPQLLVVSPGHGEEQIRWRVPILLSFPSYGPVGVVGYIDVDVADGRLLSSEERVAEIEANAEELAARLSLETAPAS